MVVLMMMSNMASSLVAAGAFMFIPRIGSWAGIVRASAREIA